MLEPGFVHLSFIACGTVTGLVMWLSRVAEKSRQARAIPVAGQDFRSFQKLYLVVYLVAMFSDWLQGPYVYALYASYGYSPGENARLFVAGFGSSMVFGTFVGSMADRVGRKKSASLYCALYVLSCLTKHVSSYWVLMVGRVTGGIATSLLCSVFDSWLVCEHNKRGFDPDHLGGTFALAIFGNSLVAIAAGVVSQMAADFMPLSPPPADTPQIHVGGYCGPFDVSICCLVLCAILIHVLWSENFGEAQSSAEPRTTQLEAMKEAAQMVFGSRDLLYCGIVSALFEASMFIFVFQWTPLVTEPGKPRPPYGTIFSTFMTACMLGSRLFSLATKFASVERVGVALLGLAVVSHAVPIVSSDSTACFCAFLLFELCVGVYFPMIGTLKSSVVPEGCRSTIYNLYRLPLNLIVVSALLMKIESGTAFVLTSFMMFVALLAQTALASVLKKAKAARAFQPVPSKCTDDMNGAELEPRAQVMGSAVDDGV